MVRISKRLSYVLRHRPDSVGLVLDETGRADVATARRVGSRRGRPVVLRVDATGLHADGAVLSRSANGVWLVAAVPPRYLSVLSR